MISSFSLLPKIQKNPDRMIFQFNTQNTKQNFVIDIAFRSATIADAVQIEDLMHAEAHPWKLDSIISHVSELYVLTSEGKIIAVFYHSTNTCQTIPNFIIVHPMFPRNSVSNALYYTMLGVVTRQPQ